MTISTHKAEIVFINKMEVFKEDLEKFWNRTEVTNSCSDCWEWIGGTSVGYPRIKIQGKNLQATRISWILHNGPIPDRMAIYHVCSNNLCINPAHMNLRLQGSTNTRWNHKKFWSAIEKQPSGCWHWKGSALNKNGYGKLTINYKTVAAHRVAWEYVHGKIPFGKCICHHCDNPTCVRPSHLYLGTHSSNMYDKYTRKRQDKRGEKHHMTKLKEADIKKICKMQFRLHIKEIALYYKTSISTIYSILDGRNWSHVY